MPCTLSWTAVTRLIGYSAAALLCACSTTKYTVDDGREVNPELLRNIRALSSGEQAIRPAIVKSAALADPDCDKQWELPIAVATSYELPQDDRVAWVRASKVDERLTVIASAISPALEPGDKIVSIDGYWRENTEKMANELVERRDGGKPFELKTHNGKTVKVTPFKVCRGYTRFAPAPTPKVQDYHWLLSFHPLEVAEQGLTDDEALWIVLWTQGLSEEGGARMKTYHYGTKIVGALYNVATIATGLKGVSMAAQAAAKTAQSVASSAATDALKKELISQASDAARRRLQDEIIDNTKRLTQKQMVDQMQRAAANRGALSGVAWVAGTTFDKADAWAFSRMKQLNGDPLAPFTLHQKLIENSQALNAFVFDNERLTAMTGLAAARGLNDDVVAVLGGFKPMSADVNLSDMPLASAGNDVNIFEASAQNTELQPRPTGFIESMLELPAESK